ncbi:MAG: TIGR00282 family metallophosphoesterase [Bacillota bacterium]|nr:TIGR00282 family metallophosphoesterase [Bacillota bacterium]
MRLLFIGDIVGKPGREMVREVLSRLVHEQAIDAVVANAENAAGHAGLTPAVAAELLQAGVDVITLGDHAWDRKELIPAIDGLTEVVRPANYPPGVPGQGWLVKELRNGVRLGVVNLLGRVFMRVQADDPFRKADEALAELRGRADVVLVDFHAEATSEKVALGWYLDGRVSAVLGSHTHVQTADERILPGGTACLSDAGMTGPSDSVLGVEKSLALERFLTQMPVRFEVAPGPRQFCAAVVDVEPESGRATAIRRIFLRENARGA